MISKKLIDAVERLELNLKGKTVLTEAATGAYSVTAVLAALAGAEVYAFTMETKYGTIEDVRQETQNLIEQLNRPDIKINIINEITPSIIAKADIITNSGHLRPLDKSKLKHAKEGVVIPLMYEAWERRDSDLDINYCNEKNIKIGATNERHPDIDVFNYLGDMALKMIFDAGLCIYRNRFILICNNDFGPYIAKVFSKVCDSLAVCDKKENKGKYNDLMVDWIGDFPDFAIPEKYSNSEAIIFTAYPFDTNWIGNKNTPISIEKIMNEIKNPLVLRFAGDIDENECAKEFKFYPQHVSSGHMGILPSAIGFDPIIRLQSGGLKVGECLLNKSTIYKGTQIVERVNNNW